MDLLNQSAFLKALGWSLLNSFWQFGLLWFVFLIISSARKNLNASVKHGLALALLVTGFGWFCIALSYRYFDYSESRQDTATSRLLQSTDSETNFTTMVSGNLESLLPYLSGIYLLIIATLFIKFFRYFYYSHKIQTQGLIKIKAEWRMFVEQLTIKLDIRKKVHVWLSQYVDTPIIVGFLKPTILIPVACMNQLTIRQLEAVILHELAHIKRNDYLLNLFVAITEIIFFFNPFSKLFTSIIQQERENSCDDWVLQFKFDRYEYASALLSLEKNRSAYLPLTIAATGENKNRTLLMRIQRILQVKVCNSINGLKLFAYFLAVALLGLVALINPGDVVIRKFAKEFQPVQHALFARDEVSPTPIKNVLPVKVNAVQSKYKGEETEKFNDVINVTEEPPLVSEDLLFINVADLAYEGLEQSTRLIAAIKHEQIEFSKTDNIQPIVPEVVSVPALPFVPSTSFSYVFVDTSEPRIKTENYYERNARASLVKAQKAVQQLNWEKIEKQLNNKVDIGKLRQEIERALGEVNWQQINEDVTLTLTKENTERLNALKKEAEEIRQFKAEQLKLQQLKNELNFQHEYLQKDVEKQQEAIRDYQKQHKKIHGKIIVYI